MIAALSLLIILAISFFLIRLAAVALKLTGMSEQNAKFQAVSALTGTGFTTRESEMVVNYPIRRKIIALLMISGNLGIVSVISTLMISFVRTDANISAILIQLTWMTGMIAFFFTIMLNSTVDRILCGLIGFILKKFTFLGGRHYQKLLQLGESLSICEHQFFSDESLSASKTQAEFEAFTILAVRRARGQTERFALDIGPINRGDTLVMLGPDKAHEEISPQLSKA